MKQQLLLPVIGLCQHIKSGSRYWVYSSATNHTNGQHDGKEFFIYAPVSEPDSLKVRECEEFWGKFTIVEWLE